jgi:hypothetical protein
MPDAAKVDSTKKEGAPDATAAVPTVKDIAETLKSANPGSEKDVRALIEQNPQKFAPLLSMNQNELEELDALLKETQLPSGDKPAAPAPEGKPADQQPSQGAAPAAPAAGAQATPDEELTIKVKKSDLGTYLTGRTAEEAIHELIKGKRNADETIRFFKEKSMPTLEKTANSLMATNQALKAEVEELKKKQAPAPQGAAPAAPAVGTKPDGAPAPAALPNVDEFLKEVDLFDPESHKKVSEYLKTLASQNSALANEINQLKTAPAPQATPAGPQPQPQAQQGLPEEARSELEQIRLLQQNPEYSGVFSSKMDIEQLDRAYASWVERLGRHLGITNIYTPEGRFRPDIISTVTAYMDPASTEGQTIRNLVEQVNDKPPEDLHVLSRIYRIRNIRNEYARRDSSGAVVPISYEEAARLARSLVPEIFTNTDPVLARQQERDAINRGAENRQKTFAPEVPAARAAQEPDVSQIQLEEFNILMKKPRKEYNAQENELVRKVMKDLAKMSDQEIEDWFKSPGG